MSDTTAIEPAETGPAGDKTAKRAARKATRRLARALHQLKWGQDNPGASIEERKTAFAASEEALMEEARALRKLFRKNGLVLKVKPGKAAGAAEASGD